MRPARYHAEDLARLLRRRTIATIGELKQALGTSSDATVFRKLAELAYRSSYSHRGRYYTLDELCRFDRLGLWSFRSVWFSRHGTLVATVEALVAASEAGYDAGELETVVHADCKQALVGLVRAGRLARERVGGRYVYLSAETATRRGQLAARHTYDAAPSLLGVGTGVRVLPDELKAAIVLFYSLLDERQRRLYAGLEAAKIGHGGDAQIAELLGIDAGTVARGRRELFTGDVERDRVRRAGGGAPPPPKKNKQGMNTQST
jgi:hypothetical protein